MTKRTKPEAPKPQAMHALPKRGRPSMYTSELGLAICERIATGEPLTKICKTEGIPTMTTIFRWLLSGSGIAEFSEMYARAREQQADALADEMLLLADDESLDPNARRVRVDTRKWLASKLKPKRYADRVDGELKINESDVAERLVAGRQRVVEMRKQAG